MPAALSVLTSEGVEHAARIAAGAARRARGRRPRLEVFARIDEPHSHLLLQALDRVRAAYDVDLELRVAGPSDPEDLGDAELHPLWARRDAAMIAPHMGLSFDGSVRSDSSRAARADRVLVRHRSDPDALNTFIAVSAAFWAGDDETINGFSAASEVEAASERAAASALRARRGHYLGATVYYEGEWYWGVDRLALLERRLSAEGHRLLAGNGPVASFPATSSPAASSPAASSPAASSPAASSPAARGAQRAAMPRGHAEAHHEVEVFYSFRSPYAYLGLERAAALWAERPVTLVPRPVAPMVRRGAAVSRAKRIYIVRDVARLAREAEVPFGRMCDPLPGFQRAAALYEVAARQGLEVPFLRSYGRGVWAEGRDVMLDRDLLDLAERAGLRTNDCEAALRRHEPTTRLDDNLTALRAHGLWGVPSFVCGELAVWGQDRLWLMDLALRRA